MQGKIKKQIYIYQGLSASNSWAAFFSLSFQHQSRSCQALQFQQLPTSSSLDSSGDWLINVGLITNCFFHLHPNFLISNDCWITKLIYHLYRNKQSFVVFKFESSKIFSSIILFALSHIFSWWNFLLIRFAEVDTSHHECQPILYQFLFFNRF